MKCKDVLNSWSATLPSILQQFHGALKKMVDRHHSLETSQLKLEAACNTVQFHLDRMEHLDRLEHLQHMGLMAKTGI